MESKIIFLGTGGESLVTARQIRASGGIVIQVEGYQFFIDPGPGALTKAAEYGINVRNTTAVLASHNHLGHANDVNAIISAMTYSGLDKKGVLICNKTVFSGTEKETPVLQDFYKECLERAIIVEAGKRIGVENIEIRAVGAEHTDPHTVGFKFFTPSFILTYSSDTKYNPGFIEDYKNSDILILNTLDPFKVKREQLNSDDAVKIIEKIRPKLAILTHFGIKMLKADTLSEAREIQKRTGVQIIAAKDGMQVNPVSYSATLRQHTLNLY